MKAKVKKVMIVDDNEFDCYITSKIVTNFDENIDIMEFNSSITAIQYLEEFQNVTAKLPDLILLDIYMPVLDGFEFIEKYQLIVQTRNPKTWDYLETIYKENYISILSK